MNGGERSRVCFLPSVTLPANRRRGRQIPSPIHQISAGAAEIGRARFRSKPNVLDTYRRVIEYRIYEKKRNQKKFLDNPMRSGKSDGIGEAFPRPCFIRKFLISPVYFPNLSYLCISSSTAESAPRTSQQQPVELELASGHRIWILERSMAPRRSSSLHLQGGCGRIQRH